MTIDKAIIRAASIDYQTAFLVIHLKRQVVRWLSPPARAYTPCSRCGHAEWVHNWSGQIEQCRSSGCDCDAFSTTCQCGCELVTNSDFPDREVDLDRHHVRCCQGLDWKGMDPYA